jgi:prepilin-type processing-associated H-X9-DG protein
MGGAAMFVLFMLFFIVMLLPSLSRARELSKRTVCAANLKGMGNGFATYATGNNDEFPIPAHLKADKDEVGRVKYAPGQIGAHRGKQGEIDAGETTTEDTEMSTTRAMWYLVRSGASSPKSFICPSSDDQPNREDNPQDFWDFRSYKEVSYGYQVPFGKFGKPSPAGEMDMVIAADKGPYGAALEAGKPNPGPPDLKPGDNPRQWRKFNSPNHHGEGQNVLYPDGHVDFVMTSLAGWERDNIYTRWSSPDEEDTEARIRGTPPTGIETPWGESDSLIYP